jgi:hypothetical protein
MQPKKYVTKNQLKTIFDSNPSANRVEILDEFLNQGYVVEGYNEPKPNLAQKVADMAIGGATNIKNTFDATMDATGSYLGKKARGIDTTYSQEMKGAVDNIQSDVTGNAATNILFGRDQQARDLSTAKGWEQLGGDALSTAATVMPAGKAMQGATLGAKVAQGAKIGATVGALGGAGTSMQEGNSLGEVAKDTFVGAGTGAAVGGLIPAVGEGLSKGAEVTKKGAQKVFSFGKDVGGNIKYNHIDPQIAESATRLANSKIEPNKLYSQFKNAQELATLDVKKPSALEVVGNEIGNAFDDVVSKRKEVGKMVGSELEKIGKQPMQIDDIVSPYAKNVMGELKKVATGKQSKFSQDEIEMLSKFDLELKTLGKNPTAQDVGDFLTRIRSEIESLKGKKNIMGVTNADRLMTEVTSNLNSRIANNFPEYAAAKSEYARLSDLLEEGVGYLGKKTLSGDYKKETSVVKSSLNSILNSGKKDFLLQLENETGKPILDKAVIAGQVMKDLGDARGESLLQMIFENGMPTKSGTISKIGDYAVNKAMKKMYGDASKRTVDYLSLPKNNSAILPNISSANTTRYGNEYINTTAKIIPPAISNISDIIKHSPELAKSAIIEMIKGLPAGVKNAIIKELANQANESTNDR